MPDGVARSTALSPRQSPPCRNAVQESKTSPQPSDHVLGPRPMKLVRNFQHPFLEQDQANAQYFVEKTGSDRLLFDLPAYVRSRLAQTGLHNTAVTGHDTYDNMDFFSYRRSCHKSETDYGRNMSVITLIENA